MALPVYCTKPALDPAAPLALTGMVKSLESSTVTGHVPLRYAPTVDSPEMTTTSPLWRGCGDCAPYVIFMMVLIAPMMPVANEMAVVACEALLITPFVTVANRTASATPPACTTSPAASIMGPFWKVLCNVVSDCVGTTCPTMPDPAVPRIACTRCDGTWTTPALPSA